MDSVLDNRPELRVTVACPSLEKPVAPWRNIALRPAGRLKGHAWEQLELPRLARRRTLFCPGNTAPLASLLGAQPVVVTVHDLSYKYFPEAYSWSFRQWYSVFTPLVMRRANAVITVSESERCAILAHYPQSAARLYAVQNGGLPGGLRVDPTAAPDTDRRYVLYVGSLSKRKNFPTLLDATYQLARARDLEFIFVGAVPQGIAASMITVPKDVVPRIKFAGQIDDTATLMTYYRSATCFVFPSLYEASPLPPIEAMACGCPVVASDIPSLKERCGDAAVYCDPKDTTSIVAAIERIVDDKALRAKLRVRGYERAASFSWENCARRTLDIISKVS